MKRNAVIIMLGALLLSAIALPAWAEAPGGAKVNIDPASLTIGTFYAGQPAKLTGEIGAGQEVILEVLGPSENVTFDLKGKVGPFWMNRGQVKVENAPTLYILLLPAKAPSEDKLDTLGLGMTHLKEAVKVSSPGKDSKELFATFLDFKKTAGLYQQKPGAVTYAPAGPDRQSFSAGFDFPSSLAAGQYKVKATVLQNGAPLEILSKTYEVEDGQFLKLVKGLAYDRSLLFGVLCVLVALVTGAVMGLVFKGGKGGH